MTFDRGMVCLGTQQVSHGKHLSIRLAAWIAAISFLSSAGLREVSAQLPTAPSGVGPYPVAQAAYAAPPLAPAQGTPQSVPLVAPATTPGAPKAHLAPPIVPTPSPPPIPAVSTTLPEEPPTSAPESESSSGWSLLGWWKRRATAPDLPSAAAAPAIDESAAAATPESAPPPDEAVPAPSPDPAAGAPVVPGAATTVVVEPPPKLWTGNFDMGLNGSDGNSKLLNLRFGALAVRKTPFDTLTFKLNYLNTRTGAAQTQTADRLFFDGRNEWTRPDARRTFYVHETTEYDQFRAFDVRVTLDAGLGYQWIKNDVTTFTSRFGPGVSREFGGPDDSWVPELVFGLALDRQLTQFQKLNATVDYFPDATNFGSYRLNSQMSWQIALNQANNLSLKLSIVDRYDSTPNGVLPNDIDYATTLVWSF